MSYPLSDDVSAGQPTAASQYNNLRADALRFGSDDADSLNVGDLLSKHTYGLNLSLLSANRLRVSATASAPVYLVIGKRIVGATANVDLPTGSVPSGAADQWYVYATYADNSSGFTLQCNTSGSTPSQSLRIGMFYWNGTGIDPESIKVTRQDWDDDLGGVQRQIPLICQGRIALSTGIWPVDVSSGATLYFNNFKGNKTVLYVNGYGWKLYTFTSVSTSLASITNGKLYDVYLYDDAGTLKLYLEEWTNSSTRAYSLASLNGVYVHTNDSLKRYVGTIRAAADGLCSDSEAQRGVWNINNQVLRFSEIADANQHTYASATSRAWNNGAGMFAPFTLGLTSTVMIMLNTKTKGVSAGNKCMVMLGEDSSTEDNTLPQTYHGYSEYAMFGSSGMKTLAPGYHYYKVLEKTYAAANGDFAEMRLKVGLMG